MAKHAKRPTKPPRAKNDSRGMTSVASLPAPASALSPKPVRMKLTQQQLEAHLWGAANILRGKDRWARLQELHPVVNVLQAPVRSMGERGGRGDPRTGKATGTLFHGKT